jgi:hypothetical protein
MIGPSAIAVVSARISNPSPIVDRRSSTNHHSRIAIHQ